MSVETDIAFEDHNWLHLRLTQRVAQAFAALKLYVRNDVTAPADPNFLIRIPKDARFESYTNNHGRMYSVGAFSYSENVVTEAVVGRYCSIAQGFAVMGERHPMERVTSSSFTYCHTPQWHKPQFLSGHRDLLGDAYPPAPPEIETGPLPVLEHDVWIGQQVILARGITVHTGAVVGAGAVVAHDVAPYTIVAGNPARPLRRRFPEEICRRLLATEWWSRHPKCLYAFGFKDVALFCERMEAAMAAGPMPALPVRSLAWTDVLATLRDL